MTPADVNRRLAEALGWKRGHSVQWTETETRHYDWGWTAPDGRSGSDLVPPPYCSDLNAIAEARKALTERERETFVVAIDAPAEPQARALLAVLLQRLDAALRAAIDAARKGEG